MATLPKEIQEHFNDYREGPKVSELGWDKFEIASKNYYNDPYAHPLRAPIGKAKKAILKAPIHDYSEEEYITLLRYIQKNCVEFDEDDGDVSIQIEEEALDMLHKIYTLLPQEQRLEIRKLLISIVPCGYNNPKANEILQEICSSLSGKEEISEFLDQVRHFISLSDSEYRSTTKPFIKILSELIISLPEDSQGSKLNCASKEFVINIILSWNTESTSWIRGDFADYADNDEVVNFVAKAFLGLMEYTTYALAFADEHPVVYNPGARRMPESQIMKVVEVTQALTYPTNIVGFVPLLPDEYLADRVVDIEQALSSKDKSQFKIATELFDLIGKHFSEHDKKKLITCMLENSEYIDPIGYSSESQIFSRFFDAHTDEAIEMFKAVRHVNALEAIINGILSSIDVSCKAKSESLIDKGFEFFRYLAENGDTEAKLHLIQNIIYCFDYDMIDLFRPCGEALKYEAHGMPERIIAFLEIFKEDDNKDVRDKAQENIEDTKQYTFEALCGKNQESDIALELIAAAASDIDVSNLGEIAAEDF